MCRLLFVDDVKELAGFVFAGAFGVDEVGDDEVTRPVGGDDGCGGGVGEGGGLVGGFDGELFNGRPVCIAEEGTPGGPVESFELDFLEVIGFATPGEEVAVADVTACAEGGEGFVELVERGGFPGLEVGEGSFGELVDVDAFEEVESEFDYGGGRVIVFDLDGFETGRAFCGWGESSGNVELM